VDCGHQCFFNLKISDLNPCLNPLGGIGIGIGIRLGGSCISSVIENGLKLFRHPAIINCSASLRPNNCWSTANGLSLVDATESPVVAGSTCHSDFLDYISKTLLRGIWITISRFTDGSSSSTVV